MGVAIGLVEGVMAPIIPIGLAISIIPFYNVTEQNCNTIFENLRLNLQSHHFVYKFMI